MSENNTETDRTRKKFQIGDPYPKGAEPIESLRWRRDAFKNNILDRIVEGSNNENKLYKVRKNWFAAVCFSMEIAILTGEVQDPILQGEIREFQKDCASDDFAGDTGRLTTKEDIERANQLITKIIGG